MCVALVLVGKEREDVDAQHVRRYQQHRSDIVADRDALFQRQHLIHQEAVGLLDQLVVRRIEVEAELVLDLFDLLVEAGDQLHDVRFAAHEPAEFFAVAVVIVDAVDQRLRALFDLIEDEAEHLLLGAHHALGEQLLIVLHDLQGLLQTQGVFAACPDGSLARDQAAVGELAHLPIGRPHQSDHVTPNARAEFGQLSCDRVH